MKLTVWQKPTQDQLFEILNCLPSPVAVGWRFCDRTVLTDDRLYPERGGLLKEKVSRFVEVLFRVNDIVVGCGK